VEISGQHHALAALSPYREPPQHIRYEVGWVPEPVWTRWRRESNPAVSAGNRTPVLQPVAQSLYWLSYRGLLFLRSSLNVFIWISVSASWQWSFDVNANLISGMEMQETKICACITVNNIARQSLSLFWLQRLLQFHIFVTHHKAIP
jgi:hypothetical protein